MGVSGTEEEAGRDCSAFKKRRVRENLTYVYPYLTGECKEDKDRLFSVVPTQRAMGIQEMPF